MHKIQCWLLIIDHRKIFETAVSLRKFYVRIAFQENEWAIDCLERPWCQINDPYYDSDYRLTVLFCPHGRGMHSTQVPFCLYKALHFVGPALRCRITSASACVGLHCAPMTFVILLLICHSRLVRSYCCFCALRKILAIALEFMQFLDKVSRLTSGQ